MNRRPLHAFTILELLIVLGVISVLLALLTPAVQRARESARAAECRNNLKQLAVGLYQYHEAAGQLPSAAYCGVYGSSSIRNCHVWLESLLPFIGEQNLFAKIDFGVANHLGVNPSVLNGWQISLLMCPSDPDKGLYPNSREANYTPGPGESLGASYIPSSGPLHMNLCPIPPMNPNINCLGKDGARLNEHAPGMFSGGWRGYKFQACTDGLSNTLFIGEALPAYSSFRMYFVSHLHTGTTNTPPNYHKSYSGCPKSRDKRIGECYAYMGGFMSEHGAGVNMALADGSVKAINESIDYTTWCNLGNKADGHPVGEF